MEKLPLPTQQEFQPSEGQYLFAESLLHAAEAGGEDAIRNYFDVALSGTEGKLSAAERHTAISFLAQEQEAALIETSLHSGETMLASIGTNNESARAALSKTTSLIRRASGPIIDAQQAVGRMVNRGDARTTSRAHEELTRIAQRNRQPIQAHTEAVSKWASEVDQSAGRFRSDMQQNKLHALALREALKTTEIDYDGGPKDLTNLIDEPVKQSTISLVQETIARAQAEDDPAESALIDLVATSSDSPTLSLVAKLEQFAVQAPQHTKQLASRTQGGLTEASRQLSIAMTRGADHYRSARNAHELLEIYRRQQRMTETAVQSLESTAQLAPRALQTIDQEVRKLQQMIKYVNAA